MENEAYINLQEKYDSMCELARKQQEKIKDLSKQIEHHKMNSVPLVVFENMYREMQKWLEKFLEADRVIKQIEALSKTITDQNLAGPVESPQ